jgi:hypothetical protein
MGARGLCSHLLLACGAIVLSLLLALPAAAQARRLPGYHSPGYAGTKQLPKVAPVPPPRPVFVSADGHAPHVLVDAAGTAHLAWSEDPNDAPGIMHYCRFPRGAIRCAATYDRAILQPSGGGNGPATDVDYDGPFPMSVGNELLLLDSRCCNNANAPDGGPTIGGPVYLFTSEDGGGSFTGPDDPNGTTGIIGTQDPSGGALVFNGNSPMIGTISDTQTGGTMFQGVPAGQFTRDKANLSTRSDQSDAYDGRLGLDGIRPVAAFDDLDGTTVVREWNGQGSVNDPANWSILKIPGAFGPRIAGGASGLLLLSHTSLTGGTLQVRSISPGAGAAGPPTNLGPASGSFDVISQSANGQAAVARTASDGVNPTVEVHTSRDGRHWNNLGAVTRVPKGDLNDLAIGVSVDGGGFVTFRDNNGSPGLLHGRIGIAQFGPTTATGQPGLGLVPGQSGPPAGDPNAYVACTKVHFGAIDALAKAGCFLRDPAHPQSGAAVTNGQIRLNGLDIIPDAGTQIAIDPHNKTINTTGKVSVQLNGTGLGPITLWHQELHVHLSTAGAGETLFDFDTSTASALAGFPFSGRIQVMLRPDAVDIPVHVALPPYFGGVNGDADLEANNTDGLVLNSLHLGIDDANIGVLELKNVGLDYTRTGSVWDGHGELLLPGPISPDIKADVRFEGGSFKHGSLELSIKPGIPVFTDVYIHDFLLGFGLHPTVIEGGVSVGVYDGIGSYPLDIIGRVKIQVGDASNPTIVFIGGTGQVLGVDLAHASFTYNSDGYVLFHIDAGIDLELVSLNFSGDVFVLHGDFGANLSAKGCLHPPLLPDVCATFDGAASPKGLSVCGGPAGVDLPDWDPTRVKLHLVGCDVSAYRLQAPPAGGASAHAAAAGERTFTVARGQRGADLDLTGVGGPPKVELVSPGGQVMAPADLNVKGAKIIAVQSPSHAETFVGIRAPQPGVWTVRPVPGSPAIASLSTAQVLTPPTVKASVSGSGAVRTLRYSVRGAVAGTKVSFAEKGKEGIRLIGRANGARGALRFTPAPGAGGTRSVIAVVTQDGFTRAQPVVAHFRAPALRRPGAVGRLSLQRKGTTLRIRFGRSSGAFRYLIHVSATGGLSTQRTTSQPGLVLRGVRPGAAISVSVRGVNIRGVRGPQRTGRRPAAGSKPRRRHPRH